MIELEENHRYMKERYGHYDLAIERNNVIEWLKKSHKYPLLLNKLDVILK
ncbi:MAG: hypothetical protein ACTSRL_06240 [Candidatus Helarchaeota archaeon]